MTIPSRIISGGSIIRAQSGSISRILQGGSLRYAARFSSIGYCLIPSSIGYGLSKGRCFLIASTITNVQSLAKVYFNDGFSQNSQNIYLSKSALSLPTGFNLSLEAFFVALMLQWVTNVKTGDEQNINSEWLGFGDKDRDYVYFIARVNFRKKVTTDVYGEISANNFTLSPLDF